MTTPRKLLAVIAGIMALAILPSTVGPWPLSSSIRQALPGMFAELWAGLTVIAWLGCVAGNIFRLKLPASWWPILVDLAGSALASISCIVYAIALFARFDSMPATWSIAPFVCLAVVYGSRAVGLRNDVLRVVANE